MDLNPSQEQKMLRDAAQKYLRAEYSFEARNKLIASERGHGPAHWARFAEFGWLGLGLPEAQGGFGGMPEIVQVCEALGGALVVEPYLPAVVLAGQAIAAAGSAAQRQALLAPLVEGKSILALASSEADSGPALAWVNTRARREGDGWVLDGAKTGVAALPLADAVVVSARTAGAPGERQGIALFVVPANAPGVVVTPFARYDGLRAGELRLDAVRLGADALLGEAEGGIDALERAVDLATVAACADAVGAMTQVLHKTGAYLSTRRQFDAPLASFQVLQHRLVDMFAALEAARSMVVMAALHADAAPPRPPRRRSANARASSPSRACSCTAASA